MAAHPHATGGYRAYKKILGHEHQHYFPSQEQAEKKQAELEQLSRELTALAARKVFSSCGRIRGFRVVLRHRAGRRPRLFMRIQRQQAGARRCKEVRYEGRFDAFWRRVRDEWAAINDLSPQDVAGYSRELRRAKQLYIADVGRLEPGLES